MNLDSDILSNIQSFLTEDYIYFAPVSRQFFSVWGNTPKITRKVSEFTTVSQIIQIVDLKNKWFQSLFDVVFLLVESNLKYVNNKVKSKRCPFCHKKFSDI